VSDTYEPVTPAGVEDKPAAVIPVHDSEKVLREMPPEDARSIFGEEVSAEWSPEQAVEELRKQRNLQNSQPSKTVKFDFDSRRGEQTDKQAAGDLSFSRRVEHANRLLEAMPRLDAERAVNTANEALTGGHVHQYALDDKDRADPLSHGDNPQQAQQRLSAMREERAAALHALAEQLSQPVEQQQQPAEAPPVEQQQQPPEPPPPVVDPIESERIRVRQEAEALASMRQMSAQETRLAFEAQQIDALLTAKYGQKVAQAGSFEAFAKQDPAAASEILQAKSAYDQRLGQVQNYAQTRQTNEALIAHARETEQVRVNMAERAKADSEFEKFVSQADPQWQDANYRESVQRMAATLIEEIAPGSSDAIRRGQVFVTASQQRALYDVARARLGDERIKETMRNGRQAAAANLPPVQRPGVAFSKGEITAGDQSARLSRLGYLSPTDAMREGAKLLSERRGRR
jgi:hypothetical protein